MTTASPKLTLLVCKVLYISYGLSETNTIGYIGNYFTGAVKNEKNNWKGVVSFRVRVGFAQDTCNLVPQSHSSTKVSFLGHCAGAKFDL